MTFTTTSYEKTSIGRGHLKQQQTRIRSDETKWLTASSDAQQRFLSTMQALQENINQHLYMGLFDYGSHFAHYKVGDFYAKHLDRLKGKTNRVLTTVLYLNDVWSKDDGGEIVLFDENQHIVEKLLPKANRLIIFLSERFPHEILPAKKDRYSITGWFRVREN